jgi:hypothetical protein
MDDALANHCAAVLATHFGTNSVGAHVCGKIAGQKIRRLDDMGVRTDHKTLHCKISASRQRSTKHIPRSVAAAPSCTPSKTMSYQF